MRIRPEYPIICRDKHDLSSVDVFVSLEDAELGLEIPDVENAEYDAWDSTGACLLLAARRTKHQPWLEVTVLKDEPVMAVDFLSDLVRDYARENGVCATKESGESLRAFAQRVTGEAEKYAWHERPWWRRFLGLPNTS